jgi:hypothetical protein
MNVKIYKKNQPYQFPLTKANIIAKQNLNSYFKKKKIAYADGQDVGTTDPAHDLAMPMAGPSAQLGHEYISIISLPVPPVISLPRSSLPAPPLAPARQWRRPLVCVRPTSACADGLSWPSPLSLCRRATGLRRRLPGPTALCRRPTAGGPSPSCYSE